jgi:amidase
MPAYIAARDKARRLAGPQGIDAALKAQQLDALVAPAMSPAWPTDPVNADHFTGAGYGAAAVARYPSITVPMGDVHGLPVGIAFMGTAWSEAAPDRTRVRLRAGQQGAQAAALPADHHGRRAAE